MNFFSLVFFPCIFQSPELLREARARIQSAAYFLSRGACRVCACGREPEREREREREREGPKRERERERERAEEREREREPERERENKPYTFVACLE